MSVFVFVVFPLISVAVSGSRSGGYLVENLKSWQCDHWGFQVECVFRYWDLALRSADALEGEI